MLDALYDDDVEPMDGEPVDELGVRRLLIEFAQTQRKAAKLADLRDRVVCEYDDRIERLNDRVDAIRSSLLVYVQANGKVSFPDVGGVHLSQRKEAPRVADADAFEAWAMERGFKVEVADTKAAKAEAAHLWKQGELAPGMELHEPEPSLVVKGVG